MQLDPAPSWAPLAIPPAEAGRASLYALVGRLLLFAPDAQVLSLLERDASPRNGQDLEALPAAWDRLAVTASRMDAEAIAAEFDAVFRAPPSLQPYGSVYLAGRTRHRPLARLREDLVEVGLRRRDAAGAVEDHLGAICEAMSLLIAGPARVRQSHAGQAAFFERHLLAWYGYCLDDIASLPAARFYADVAGFARAFLDAEAEGFSLEADVPFLQ